MATWRVEMTGEVREVYVVAADSEEEAMANWAKGTCIIQETLYVEPVSAREQD